VVGIVLGLLVSEFSGVFGGQMAEGIAEMMSRNPIVFVTTEIVDGNSDFACIVFEMVGKIFVGGGGEVDIAKPTTTAWSPSLIREDSSKEKIVVVFFDSKFFLEMMSNFGLKS